jgi:cytochrome c biogenesis protein CcmG, thiol:disulfide interchange protein DsbE
MLVIPVLMIAAGIGFIYLTVRPNPGRMPAGAFQWTAVVLSGLLVVVAVFLFVLIVAAPGGGFAAGERGMPSAQSAEMNRPARDFDFRLVDDDSERSLRSYAGQVVLLNIWATWCPPCLHELPDLNRLQETYRDQGLVVITLSDETRGELQRFQQTMPLRTVSAYLAAGQRLPQPFERALGIRPSTFLIDREGVLREYVMGARDFATFERIVSPYLTPPVAGL